MATFRATRGCGLEGFGDGRQGRGEGGDRRVLAAGDVSVAHRRAGRQDQPRGADGGGARRVLRDGAERHARPHEGVSADRTTVRATITADKGDAGIKIMSSKLEVTAYGLKGADAAQFTEIAKQAEGRCPVSNAYRGTMQITVEAKVA